MSTASFRQGADLLTVAGWEAGTVVSQVQIASFRSAEKRVQSKITSSACQFRNDGRPGFSVEWQDVCPGDQVRAAVTGEHRICAASEETMVEHRVRILRAENCGVAVSVVSVEGALAETDLGLGRGDGAARYSALIGKKYRIFNLAFSRSQRYSTARVAGFVGAEKAVEYI